MRRYFVFSDVHGHYNELIEGLNKAGYDENNTEHIIVSLGDNFDRGCQNFEVFKYLNSIPSEKKILIRGNHEVMLDDLIDRGIIHRVDAINGVADTFLEFNDRFEKGDLTPVKEFIKSMKYYHEVSNHIFVHGYIPNVSYTDSSEEEWGEAVWTNTLHEISNLPKINKTIVCGHVFARRFNRLDEIFYIPKQDKKAGFIAVDSAVVYSYRINILVMEEDGTYLNKPFKNMLLQKFEIEE